MGTLREEILASAEVIVKVRLAKVRAWILKLSLEEAELRYKISVEEAFDAQA